MDYLVYVSHDAENLQFYLWLQDYTKRFYAAPRPEQVLSPPWFDAEAAAAQPSSYNATTTGTSTTDGDKPPPRTGDKSRVVDLAEYEMKYEIAVAAAAAAAAATAGEGDHHHHQHPPLSPVLSVQGYEKYGSGFDNKSVLSGINSTRTIADSVDDANTQMGLRWQSCKSSLPHSKILSLIFNSQSPPLTPPSFPLVCKQSLTFGLPPPLPPRANEKTVTIQPFRSEINRVISHYLAPTSPRELNISHRTRSAVLHALQHTTHPSALTLVKEMVEAALRGQSHPNFIRWSICNGNKPRVLFVRNSGILHVLAAVILGTLLVLSSASRWWRVLCFPLFFVGIGIGIAAYKGLCVIIHKSHSRALRPWEQFGDVETGGRGGGTSDNLNDDSTSIYISHHDIHADEEAAAFGHSHNHNHNNNNKNDIIINNNNNNSVSSTDDVYSLSQRSKKAISLDTFGTSNSYGHESWVDRYRKQTLFKKIFAKQIWVQDQTVRLIQDRIVLQSYVWSLICSVPLTALFLALPVAGII